MFLDHLHAIDGAIKKNQNKHILHNKIGRNLVVFDELRRMLMIVSSDKVSYFFFFKLGSNNQFRTAFIACL